jgi:hypothetical protein
MTNIIYDKLKLSEINQKVIQKLIKKNLYTPVTFTHSALGPERGSFYQNKNNEPTIKISSLSWTDLITNGIGGAVADLFGITRSAADTPEEVLFHEYGHAYQHAHNSVSFKRQFSKVFGNSQTAEEYNETIHISPYAALETDEDFAECFMYFMAWNGDWKTVKLFGKEYSNGVYNKIAFIDSLSKRRFL